MTADRQFRLVESGASVCQAGAGLNSSVATRPDAEQTELGNCRADCADADPRRIDLHRVAGPTSLGA
eukprot:13161597-Alexandrium_andersonii.AAC.1